MGVLLFFQLCYIICNFIPAFGRKIRISKFVLQFRHIRFFCIPYHLYNLVSFVSIVKPVGFSVLIFCFVIQSVSLSHGFAYNIIHPWFVVWSACKSDFRDKLFCCFS